MIVERLSDATEEGIARLSFGLLLQIIKKYGAGLNFFNSNTITHKSFRHIFRAVACGKYNQKRALYTLCMATNIQINLKHQSYLREPEGTELGRKIIAESIRLLDVLGYEDFTFKKLAGEIGSTEASVYRYFENKHKLLVYLVSWYWAWLHYLVTLQTRNIADPRKRLSRAIEVIARAGEADDPTVWHIDERALHRVVVAEASKVYHTKEVDAENKEGYFLEMKHLCQRLAQIVLEINPDYPYPHALMSTVLEAAHQQLFFAQHLPSLTNVRSEKYTETVAFLKQLVFAAVDNS